MKTAMQELLKYVDTMPFAGSKEHSHIVNVIQQELIPKEKAQIRNAFNEGRISFSMEIGGGEFAEEEIPSFKNANDYYDQTYIS